jgi:alcohol dehydrogenase
MHQVIAKELEILGSHGMPAHDYGAVFGMILDGKLDPRRLVHKTIPLDQAPAEFDAMSQFNTLGATVIDRF